MEDNSKNQQCFFPHQASSMDVPSSMEQPIATPPNPLDPSMFDVSVTTILEPSIPLVPNRYIPPTFDPNAKSSAENKNLASPSPFQLFVSTHDQVTFMPTPSLPPLNEPITPCNELIEFGSMDPFPIIDLTPVLENPIITPPSSFVDLALPIEVQEYMYHLPWEDQALPQPQGFPPTSSFGLENQKLYMGSQPIDPYFEPNPKYLYPLGNPMEPSPTWTQLNSSMAQKVGAEFNSSMAENFGSVEERVYICEACGAKFYNAQAYGGHMSSHSRLKKVMNPVPESAGRSKKAKNRPRSSKRRKVEKIVKEAAKEEAKGGEKPTSDEEISKGPIE